MCLLAGLASCSPSRVIQALCPDEKELEALTPPPQVLSCPFSKRNRNAPSQQLRQDVSVGRPSDFAAVQTSQWLSKSLQGSIGSTELCQSCSAALDMHM